MTRELKRSLYRHRFAVLLVLILSIHEWNQHVEREYQNRMQKIHFCLDVFAEGKMTEDLEKWCRKN